MKVPTYQSQGVVTSKVGATQFSVQANPSALTAGAAAFTQVAAGAQKESLAWYEQELKAERASKLAAAENEFKIILDNEQILAKTNAQQNPSKALKNYNKVVSNSSKRIAGKIDDGIVKKRFLASAASNVSNKRLSVMQTVRNSAIDIGKAQIITRATQLENIIATGNPAEKSKAQIELFGVEISPGKFVGGLYQNAARTGYFTNVEATNKNLSARGNVARIGVRQQISNAAISGKPGDALVVLQNLSDPKNFPFLKPADRDNLLREANNLVGTLERRRIAEDNRTAKKNTKDLKIKQQGNFDNFITNLIEASRDGSTVQLPTTNQILQSYKNADIDDKQFKILNDLILGKDAPVSDASVVVGFHERLAEAKNNDEIMEVIEEVKSNIGLNGSLVVGDAVNIIKTAKGYLNSSSESNQIKRYAGILKTAIGDSAGGISMGGYKQKTSTGLLRADAMSTYYTLVTDGKKSPLEAYKEVAGMYARNLEQDIGFIAPTSALSKAIGKKEIKNWTKDDIIKAREFVKSNPINPTTNKRIYSPIEVVLEKETINEIETYQIDKGNFIKQLKAQKGQNDTDAKSGGVSTWDSILSIFSSSEEDDIKNPK
jgi:hypothetical protein